MNRIKRQLPLFPHSIFYFFWLIDQSKALWKISIPTAEMTWTTQLTMFGSSPTRMSSPRGLGSGGTATTVVREERQQQALSTLPQSAVRAFRGGQQHNQGKPEMEKVMVSVSTAHKTKPKDETDYLRGVLQQVSDMTMNEEVNTPRMLSSTPPTTTLSSLFLSSRTPLHAAPAEVMKRNRSPPLNNTRKKPKSGFPVQPTDARVMNAPPLPSSPDLSLGRGSNATAQPFLPAQFSPIPSLTITAPRIPTRRSPGVSNTESSLHTPLDKNEQNPPHKLETVATLTTNSMDPPPPAMPCMDTPETVGRKSLPSLNHLKMRKRNTNNRLNPTMLPFGA